MTTLPSRSVTPADDHYFSTTPSVPSQPNTITVSVRGYQFPLRTDRGTFSPVRLDPGTELLLERAPAPPDAGTFLDLGCGYGPVAAVLAQESPGARVVGVDVNERALDLCRHNAAALGLDNVEVHEPDACDRAVVAHGGLDLIWSNPPIRVGKAVLHELLDRWLGHLRPDGEAVMVVSRHLGADSLQSWLDARGYATERLASRRGYRLLHARAEATDPANP